LCKSLPEYNAEETPRTPCHCRLRDRQRILEIDINVDILKVLEDFKGTVSRVFMNG
jgi:hypothetical protein